MPIYLFWGDDDFTMTQIIEKKRKEVVDPNWIQFNYDKLPGDQDDEIIQGLNQIMTSVFGMGGRLVWLENTTLCQSCSDYILNELSRTLPVIPENAHLLLSTPKKPDQRIKSTKLIQKYAQVKEFSLIPPWNTEGINKQVRSIAAEIGVKLTPQAIELLGESVGNQTRQLWRELEKLKLYGNDKNQALDVNDVALLVPNSTQNSLKLANSIIRGNTPESLTIISELIQQNEPALRILATLVGQFRTWTMIKLMEEKGEKDESVIASMAELSNPKRLYFLRKEIGGISGEKLLASFPILLELESQLKLSANSLEILETKIIELCHLYRRLQR
jgi:DNA polymerase III subunit delta